MRHKTIQINKWQVFLIALVLLVCENSCKKEWLDAKPSQSIVVPDKIADLQAVLDNTSVFNENQPWMGEAGSDDYFVLDADFDNLPIEDEKRIYTWAPGNPFYVAENVFAITDWTLPYKAIFSANTVLENLDKITPTSANNIAWSNIKGSALFYRAYSYFALAQLFCKPYITTSANNDAGIVLRSDADINIHPGRSTVKETYDQVIGDLLACKSLLQNTQQYKTRPSKWAAYAMLARVYLSMDDYDNAMKYSDSSLQISNSLLGYNSLDPVSNPYPLPRYDNGNNETIFYAYLAYSDLFPVTIGGIIDTSLLQLYQANDLRKDIFFDDLGNAPYTGFVGSYTNDFYFFSGLATDEMYLIRAECFARKGNTSAAMQDLNTLLVTRWKTGTFSNLTATDANDALRKVLTERRKELCFRGIRWTDLRRLNQDNNFAITLKRVVHGQTYTMPPNDNRYVYPIPNSEILYSNISQNPR